MTIEVRLVAPGDDLHLAGRIVQQAYFDVPGYPHDEWFDAELADVVGRPAEAQVVLGFVDGQLAGCLTFVADTASELYEFAERDATTFRYFGVTTAARGTGVAPAMVQWCVEETRRLGVGRIRIHTLDVMHVAARMYARLGFARDPDRDENWDGAIGLAYVLDV
jgi:GNAT superfamily N-acetyltransferase